MTAEEVAECMLTQREGEEQNLSSLQRLRQFGSYIFSPRGLEEDGRRLFRTIIPCYEDTNSTAKHFQIGKEDFNGRIYFLLLHLWSLHCALQKSVSEFRVPAILREQQFTSLGFCVSLDEAFEDEKGFPAGQLAHRLWVTVFEAAESKRESSELIELTTYALRARSFALQLSRDALIQGTFRWPTWPPVEAC
ncbi:hypothetical protein, conserved [Eimeria necatrix]|uniref:Ubiquinol-cytochrome c chaperone domain-containing protein n=1 Tax=Eimeria necatrix TaxID=51315 RepID=U6MND7_9EIME|nr:hypothetical protein, conserved [Eimeria necatrix]CDJ63175.1 hypothetical protein, conserved [Eimeria necatrix]